MSGSSYEIAAWLLGVSFGVLFGCILVFIFAVGTLYTGFMVEALGRYIAKSLIQLRTSFRYGNCAAPTPKKNKNPKNNSIPERSDKSANRQ